MYVYSVRLQTVTANIWILDGEDKSPPRMLTQLHHVVLVFAQADIHRTV
jgi:hypothetical protein